MQRLTFSIDDELAEAFDVISRQRGYQSRSEAVRDLIRSAVNEPRLEDSRGQCVANLSYIYDHHTRALAARLVDMQHDHHDLVLATTHVHLDNESCLETVMLKGMVERVRGFADDIKAERGVRSAVLNIVPMASADRAKPEHPVH
jgi:CopG family nickel-responsive transcriptional regulator